MHRFFWDRSETFAEETDQSKLLKELRDLTLLFFSAYKFAEMLRNLYVQQLDETQVQKIRQEMSSLPRVRSCNGQNTISSLRTYVETISATNISARHRKESDSSDHGSREAGRHQFRSGRTGSADSRGDSQGSSARHSGRAERLHVASRTAGLARTRRRRLSTPEALDRSGDHHCRLAGSDVSGVDDAGRSGR